MKSTFRVLFFLKRDKVKKNGNMPIMARITIDGKLVQFNTKLEVNPKNWFDRITKFLKALATTFFNRSFYNTRSADTDIDHGISFGNT